MSQTEEHKSGQETGDSAQQKNTGLNNDPGKASQRGAHVNDSRAEDPSRRDTDSEPEIGGMRSDRNDEKEPEDYTKGDSTQPGTQNRSAADSDSGAGSGNLTAENRERRTDKFGPDKRNDETGL